jgi:hypothetical protein
MWYALWTVKLHGLQKGNVVAAMKGKRRLYNVRF